MLSDIQIKSLSWKTKEIGENKFECYNFGVWLIVSLCTEGRNLLLYMLPTFFFNSTLDGEFVIFERMY